MRILLACLAINAAEATALPSAAGFAGATEYKRKTATCGLKTDASPLGVNR